MKQSRPGVECRSGKGFGLQEETRVWTCSGDKERDRSKAQHGSTIYKKCVTQFHKINPKSNLI